MINSEFLNFKKTVHEIRNKCPWDKEQTHETLKKYLIEESYEFLESIDEKNAEHMKKELGDVLLQIFLHAEIASEANNFTIEDVFNAINKKMIERHPHVFSDAIAKTSQDVLNNWELNKIKSGEKHSLLDGVPKAMPALVRAERLQNKSKTVGFDWDNMSDVLAKVKEEITELEECLNDGKTKQEEELGDLLFAIVNLARHLEIDAESALQKASNKYTNRFKFIEKQFNTIEEMKLAGLTELDKHWNDAKKNGL
jgi:tetrapyrrole methylase family protein/MazG family protein